MKKHTCSTAYPQSVILVGGLGRMNENYLLGNGHIPLFLIELLIFNE